MHLLRASILLSPLLIDLTRADYCQNAGVSVSTQSQANHYKACKTFPGSIAIDPNFPGSINLDGIEEIQGSLTCGDGEDETALKSKNGSIPAISSSTLRTIGRSFRLSGLTSLDKLHLPVLRSVGEIQWARLPNLHGFDLGAGLDRVGNVSVMYTGLGDVAGLGTRSVDGWALVGNENLARADLAALTTYKSFRVDGNSPRLAVDLSGVTAAGESRFAALKSVNLSSLETTTGDLALRRVFSSTMAFPALRRASSISLQIYQGMSVHFPSLRTVHGDFVVSGNVTNITIPALEGVDGSLKVTSDANINCSIFEDTKISRSASCKSNGQATKLDSDSDYSNAEPTASVGNPASMTFAPDKDNSGVRLGLEWGGRMAIPLLAAVVLTL